MMFEICVEDLIDGVGLSHPAAMLSLRRIKSFVFAHQASPTREFSARLSGQKQAFCSPETQHGRRVRNVYSSILDFIKTVAFSICLLVEKDRVIVYVIKSGDCCRLITAVRCCTTWAVLSN